jgi:hypothetical protein
MVSNPLFGHSSTPSWQPSTYAEPDTAASQTVRPAQKPRSAVSVAVATEPVIFTAKDRSSNDATTSTSRPQSPAVVGNMFQVSFEVSPGTDGMEALDSPVSSLVSISSASESPKEGDGNRTSTVTFHQPTSSADSPSRPEQPPAQVQTQAQPASRPQSTAQPARPMFMRRPSQSLQEDIQMLKRRRSLRLQSESSDTSDRTYPANEDDTEPLPTFHHAWQSPKQTSQTAAALTPPSLAKHFSHSDSLAIDDTVATTDLNSWDEAAEMARSSVVLESAPHEPLTYDQEGHQAGNRASMAIEFLVRQAVSSEAPFDFSDDKASLSSSQSFAPSSAAPPASQVPQLPSKLQVAPEPVPRPSARAQPMQHQSSLVLPSQAPTGPLVRQASVQAPDKRKSLVVVETSFSSPSELADQSERPRPPPRKIFHLSEPAPPPQPVGFAAARPQPRPQPRPQLARHPSITVVMANRREVISPEPVAVAAPVDECTYLGNCTCPKCV